MNPGETAEYTVRVYNDGANPVSVNLAAIMSRTARIFAAIGQIGQPLNQATMLKHSSMSHLHKTLRVHVSHSNANANEQPTLLTNPVRQHKNQQMLKLHPVMAPVLHYLE